MAKIGERQERENDAGAAIAVGEPPAETEETTETGTPAAAPPPEPGEPKRGRGRPPSPPKPEIRFFDRLKNLSLADWENYMAYLYRTQPFTDAKKGGASSNYVTKYGQAFDEEVVKHECGSGGYKILLNCIGSDGKSRTIGVYFFDILDPNFPPKIAAGIWLDDPRNEKWAWAKAAYDEQGKTQQPAAPAGAGVGDMPGALDAVGRIIQVLRPGDGASAADPISQLNAISELLDRHKPAQPAPPPVPPDPITQFAALATALKDLRPEAPSTQGHDDLVMKLMAQNLELMNKVTQMRTPAAPASSINEALDTIDKLKGLFAGESQNPWIAAITTIVDKLGPAAEAYAAQRAMPAAASAPGGQPPAEHPAGEPSSPPPGGPEQEAFLHMRAMVLQIAGPLLSHLQNGQPGEDFAAWFIDGYGYGFHNQLKALGKEQIMLVVKSIPELWTQLQPMDQLFSAFLDEFLTWAPPEQDQTVDMPPGKTEEPTQ